MQSDRGAPRVAVHGQGGHGSKDGLTGFDRFDRLEGQCRMQNAKCRMGSSVITIPIRGKSAFAKPAAVVETSAVAKERARGTERGSGGELASARPKPDDKWGNPILVPPPSDATFAFPVLTMRILAYKVGLSMEKKHLSSPSRQDAIPIPNRDCAFGPLECYPQELRMHGKIFRTTLPNDK